jgi:hypothetical protein
MERTGRMERGERERMMSSALWHFLRSTSRSGARSAPHPLSARQLASTRRRPWQSTDCQSQPPAKRSARTPPPSSPSARGGRVATHPHWVDWLIPLSTCMARLVDQAAGLLSLLPCCCHPLWPAHLCRRHQPGPRRHGSTTLMAYCPACTTTPVQTLQPTPTSPPPLHAGPSCRRRRLSLPSPCRFLPTLTPGTPTPNSWLIIRKLARRIFLIAIIVAKAFAASFFPFLSFS